MQVNKSSRLTGITVAATRLKENHYKTLKRVIAGQLQAEWVDGKPKIVVTSLERLERELAHQAAS
jgi:hypothetical protein